jgi:hypothetical protein
MRLNFSYVAPPVIEEGISRLGSVLKEALVTSPAEFSETHIPNQIV